MDKYEPKDINEVKELEELKNKNRIDKFLQLVLTACLLISVIAPIINGIFTINDIPVNIETSFMFDMVKLILAFLIGKNSNGTK